METKETFVHLKVDEVRLVYLTKTPASQRTKVTSSEDASKAFMATWEDGTIEHHEQAISNFFKDFSAKRLNNWVNDLFLTLEQFHGLLLISIQLLCIANYISKYNGSKFVFFRHISELSKFIEQQI